MTNQNTAQREHEPPTEPEKIRSSSNQQLLQKDDQLATTSSTSSSSNSAVAGVTTAPTTTPIGLKSALHVTQGLSSASANQLNSHTHSSSNPTNIGNNISSSSSNSRGSQQNKGSGSGATNNNSRQETVEGARESSSAPYSLYQPYSTLFSGGGASGGTNNSGGGPERCHTTSPVGMHHQQRLMSPSSSQYYSGSSRLMKTHRDTQSMLQKRPLSADGGASEAKRSPRMLMMSSSDRTRLHSPPVHSVDHRMEEGREDRREEMDAEGDDEEEGEDEGSDMRNAMDEMEAEEERLRDTKRNIKLLANSGGGRGEEDQRQRPRSRQHHHLESGKNRIEIVSPVIPLVVVTCTSSGRPFLFHVKVSEQEMKFMFPNFSRIPNLANQVLNVLKYQIVDISSRLTPQPSGSQGGGSGSSIAKSEIGRSITSILGNSTEISASGGGGAGGGGPSTSALPPMQQVPLVRKGRTQTAMRRMSLCGCVWANNKINFRLFVPLQSLKKEIDWDRADNKSPADFRHPSLADMVSLTKGTIIVSLNYEYFAVFQRVER